MSELRSKLVAFAEEIARALEKSGTADDWIDQAHSPLGRAKHIALVKSGALPGAREGKQVLVRRRDLDAYLAKHAVVVVDEKALEQREIDRVVAMATRRRQG